jgi:hypothetical protein
LAPFQSAAAAEEEDEDEDEASKRRASDADPWTLLMAAASFASMDVVNDLIDLDEAENKTLRNGNVGGTATEAAGLWLQWSRRSCRRGCRLAALVLATTADTANGVRESGGMTAFGGCGSPLSPSFRADRRRRNGKSRNPTSKVKEGK